MGAAEVVLDFGRGDERTGSPEHGCKMEASDFAPRIAVHILIGHSGDLGGDLGNDPPIGRQVEGGVLTDEQVPEELRGDGGRDFYAVVPDGLVDQDPIENLLPDLLAISRNLPGPQEGLKGRQLLRRHKLVPLDGPAVDGTEGAAAVVAAADLRRRREEDDEGDDDKRDRDDPNPALVLAQTTNHRGIKK